MNKLIATLAIATAIAAAPAAAVTTFSAVESFNGVNGNGGFSYGYTGGTALTAFTASGNCVFGGSSTCLYFASNNAAIPQASLGGSAGTVNVPTDALVLHPGDSDTLAVYGGFTSATTKGYSYTINLQSIGTDTGTGVGYTPFTEIGGVVTLGTRGVLPAYLTATTLTGNTVIAAGQTFGVIIDRNGSFAGAYGGDSTALTFTVSTIPEPATWGLMLAGFTMVGFATRRRKAFVTA